jgi:hypothetical protein
MGILSAANMSFPDILDFSDHCIPPLGCGQNNEQATVAIAFAGKPLDWSWLFRVSNCLFWLMNIQKLILAYNYRLTHLKI